MCGIPNMIKYDDEAVCLLYNHDNNIKSRFLILYVILAHCHHILTYLPLCLKVSTEQKPSIHLTTSFSGVVMHKTEMVCN